MKKTIGKSWFPLAALILLGMMLWTGGCASTPGGPVPFQGARNNWSHPAPGP